MNIHICRYEPKVFEYMVSHGNTWVSQEDLTVSNPIILSTYLALKQNVREVIKIEEVYVDESDNGKSNVSTKYKTRDFWFGVEEKPYICTTSGKQFPLDCQLECHKGIHQGEKQFSQSINLMPQKTHTEEKPFKCGECNKQFSKGST